MKEIISSAIKDVDILIICEKDIKYSCKAFIFRKTHSRRFLLRNKFAQ